MKTILCVVIAGTMYILNTILCLKWSEKVMNKYMEMIKEM